jgi:hypothetical protein
VPCACDRIGGQSPRNAPLRAQIKLKGKLAAASLVNQWRTRRISRKNFLISFQKQRKHRLPPAALTYILLAFYIF